MDLLSAGDWAFALYPIMAAAVALDAAIPPIPSEAMVIAAGSLSARGDAILPLALAAAVLGSILGDLLVYSLFKRRLTHVLDRFQWGRMVHKGIRKAAAKGGRSSTAAAMVAGRFIPAGRTATMAAAGIANVSTLRVCRASALGSVIWACWMVGLGYLTGRNTSLPFWANSLIGVGVGLAIGVLMAGMIALRRRQWKYRRAVGPMDTSAAEPDDVAGPSQSEPGS
ncbi:DedA family protein [Arthrobacter sp. H14-L1]|uniref:DedA family protein n=1 Tax=Arthrobacter sp. H14-L1 TaxID=2996697 RepID=UPI002271B65F|nr:VTT domain-containing protein [Arthrobacter sp. H14-L1]MCY0905588.1 VTT domain-containing protein [Arthrobacter sp. H14-L1]